ncbi:MAG: flagellar type III secretion system pore protein FliP [Clostridium sp.]|uniref:flagellar type III secretion system pore protein FliP n=1 Tax=Clostridium sp. DSM 8431 TaxID=1761781 RepID=UPI0008E37798|nr:flagellar type III secretion system pore protein FliP [Clostridium sp. DSM 8431]MCR4944396.1 flagellar type III secretion system pore protein FliP [Clostridium sp.]SFU30995.1 flagellar biosynthetic protein FliP [Clostridium sp. DSM 8431]
MKKRNNWILMFLFSIIIVGISGVVANAAPTTVDLPSVNIDVGGSGTSNDYVSNIKLLIFFTVLSLLPSIIIMVTSFTRIVVVFSFLKTALGAAQSIPSQILTGLAIFLTLFIMQPVYSQINENAIKPYLNNTITQEEAIEQGGKPLREFLLLQTRQKDLELFVELSGEDTSEMTEQDVPFYILVPAFAISELKTAFSIGFLLYLPFILIDIVVGSVLMSMGMMMLPPAMVSLPFKLLLFVMVDGWHLLVKSLVMSFS